jgi:hypothetical protein
MRGGLVPILIQTLEAKRRTGRPKAAAGDILALALGHDGLRVFANRILANGIFADRILADWGRRRRGWLFTWQIGGSGNTQHGEARSCYRYDFYHA